VKEAQEGQENKKRLWAEKRNRFQKTKNGGRKRGVSKRQHGSVLGREGGLFL